MYVALPRPLAAGTPVWGLLGLAIAFGAECRAQSVDVSGLAASAPASTYLELSGERVPRLSDAVATRIEAVGWSQRRGSAFGVSIGATFDPPGADAPGQPMRSALGVGLHWRSQFGQRQRLDVATWRSLSEDVREPAALTARIEMQFTSPQKAFVERGAFGLQLSGDSRVLMRLRHGGPMLYYRSRF